MRKIFFLFVLLSWALPSLAQNTMIRGQVVSSDSTPVEAVHLRIEGSTHGTVSNENGEFLLSLPLSGKHFLLVSFVGMETQRIPVTLVPGKEQFLRVVLPEGAHKVREVVVADRKKEEDPELSQGLRLKTPVIEVPQNIQTISGELLSQQQNLTMLEGVSRNVSGVQMIEHWGTFARMNMRGFKIPAFRNGMNVDLPWGPLTEDLSLVQNIEFVKGPAGFMLSYGEPGGFYNVVTRKAQPGNGFNEFGLTMGSFNTLRTHLNTGGNLGKSKQLYYQLNLMGLSQGSHRDYEFNKRYSIAPSLYYQLSDKTSLSVEYIHQYSQMSVVGAAYVFSPNGYGDADRNISLGEPNIEPTTINEHNLFVHLDHQLSRNWQLSAQLGYLSYKQIGSSLWASDVDSTGNVYRTLGVWDAQSDAKLAQAYVNGEFRTFFIKHRVLAGLDMGEKTYYADWFQSEALGGNVPFNIYNPQHGVPTDSIPTFDRSKSIRQRASGSYFAGQVQRYAALYVQDEFTAFKDRVHLTLAARYTQFSSSTYGTPTDDEVVTPRVGLNIRVLKSLHAYALYDQSFIPQGGSDFEGNTFVPEKAVNQEAGLKGQFLKNRLKATVAYFHITKDNVLTSDPQHQFFSIQLGQVVSKGLEFDLQGQITSDLSIVFNYANTNVKVTEDTDPEQVGKRVAGHARHIHNAWLNYRFSRTALKGFGISLGYQHQIDRSSWAWASENQAALPDYFRLDGALSYSIRNFHLGLNVNNLLDDYLYSGSSYSTFYYWQSEPGRNYRLQVRYTF